MRWSLKGKPFKVQQRALDRTEEADGFNWFMEQGLGKTPVAMEDYLRRERAGDVDHMVVVCPNSLKSNWPDEAIKWNAPVEFQTWDNLKHWNPKHSGNGSIFNYEALLQSGGDVIEKLLESRRCMLVLDEGHRIKNPNSAITRRVLGHYSKFATLKRNLTGTPMTNTALDFYPQIRFAGGINGMNPIIFKKKFCVEVPGFKGHKKIVGVRNEEELQELINQWGFRATKEQWADLPPKLYKEPIKIEMPSILRKHYQTMMEEFIVMLADDEAVTAEAVAGQYLKLQQISSGFIFDGEKIAHRLILTINNPKFRALMDVIDANGSTSKTLVFAHFRPTCGDLISNIAEEMGHMPAYIVGGMKPEEVRAQKEVFNSLTGPQVMVLQLSAGKEGHTLLGDPDKNPCHTVCYYENNFNLGDRIQSEDRPHRYGQRNAVLYVDFSSSPIETLVIRAYQKKKKLVDFLLDNKQGWAKDE